MDQGTAIEVAIYFRQRLVESRVRVSKLILFGSHARGEAGDESDVDLLVVSEDFRGKSIFDRVDLVGDLERETIHRFQVPLDVLMMTPEEFDSGTSLMAQAARTGTVLVPDVPEPVPKSRASPE